MVRDALIDSLQSAMISPGVFEHLLMFHLKIFGTSIFMTRLMMSVVYWMAVMV
jgi:hypothetical protein